MRTAAGQAGCWKGSPGATVLQLHCYYEVEAATPHPYEELQQRCPSSKVETTARCSSG